MTTIPVEQFFQQNHAAASYFSSHDEDLRDAVYETALGTKYLSRSRALVLAYTQPAPGFSARISEFLSGFDESLGYSAGANDYEELHDPEMEHLMKFAGQLCYLSFNDKATKNADMGRYLGHIKESGHGSILEHGSVSFLFYGIDRGVTHEIVRHRAGFGFSQVSQRYVSGAALRFVMRPEYINHNRLRKEFQAWIDVSKMQYDKRAEFLLADMVSDGTDQMYTATERRKAVNQAARACLPNETEAPIVVTANLRGLRNFLEQRGSYGADRPIRDLAIRTFLEARKLAPTIFDDFEFLPLKKEKDPTDCGIVSRYKKVLRRPSPRQFGIPWVWSGLTRSRQLMEFSETQVQAMIEVVCADLGDLLIEKNKAYGNSALDPVRIFSKADSKEQLKVRIDDKLSRLTRGSDAGEDVRKDLLGYLVLWEVLERLEAEAAEHPVKLAGLPRGRREKT